MPPGYESAAQAGEQAPARAFYVLPKTLDLLVTPLIWAIVLILASAWGAHRRRPRLAILARLAAVTALRLLGGTRRERHCRRARVGRLDHDVLEGEYYAVVVFGGIATVIATNTGVSAGGSTEFWPAKTSCNAVGRVVYRVMRYSL